MALTERPLTKLTGGKGEKHEAETTKIISIVMISLNNGSVSSTYAVQRLEEVSQYLICPYLLVYPIYRPPVKTCATAELKFLSCSTGRKQRAKNELKKGQTC